MRTLKATNTLTGIKTDKTTSIIKLITENIYRNKRAIPDPCFNLHKVVAFNFSVLEDAFDSLAFCTLAVLSVKKTILTKGNQ